MRRWVLRTLIATSIVAIILSCTSISYSVLHHFYGESHTVTSIVTVSIENYGQDATVVGALDVPSTRFEAAALVDYAYSVVDVENLPEEDGLRFCLSPKENAENQLGGSAEHVWDIGGEPMYTLDVKNTGWHVWKRAQETEGPVTISDTTTTETKPIDVAPISSIIGITAGVIVAAVWVSRRHPWGDAVSTLYEHGLTNMTVRDVKILGEIMKLEKFTIPQLIKQTHSSKITVWRAVQKLIEQGLVQPTEQSIPSSNGLGGRGKPSRVYKYISKEQS